MQSEELIEKAIDKAVSALIDEHPMGHWRGDQVKEVARRAIAEAALSAAEPQPAPSVAVKALQAVRDELRVDTSSGSPGSISYEVGALHRIVAAVDAALSAQVQDVAGWEAIAKAAQDYVDAVSGEPEKDCWDTEDGKEAPGADKFASDWAWKEYDDAKQKAFDNLRAMLAAAPAKQEG